MKRFFVSTAVALAFAATSAVACSLTPGGAGCSTQDAVNVMGTQLTQVSAPYTAPTIQGTMNEWVYTDSGSGLCAGCLDFILQVSSSASSSDGIEHITLGQFPVSGASLVAGYDTGTVPVGGTSNSGGTNYLNVSESATGTVNFGFGNTLSTELMPGHTSYLLAIETNLKFLSGGFYSVQDNTSVYTPAYVASGVPEPMSLGLLGGGLAALGLMRWRKARKS
jgi:hypothetical protein